MKKGFLSFFLS